MAAALNLLLITCLLQGALCQVFKVITPQSIEVLNGSCVTIPCSFDIENKYAGNLDDTCKAIWKNKSNDDIVFNSIEQTRTNGELRGILTEKDCTTTLNNITPHDRNEYYFRLECDNPLKYDFKKDSEAVDILVKADPPRPTLTPSTLKVKEGSSVSLKCSAPAPCLSHPPTLTWTPSLGDSQETLQENEDKTKVQTSVLTFTASHLHHGKEISCTAAYSKQDGSTELATSGSLMLNISFAPQILSSSDCTKTAAQLNCSCETVGNPSPTVQWYLDGLPVNHSDKFAITNEPLNDTGLSFINVSQPQQRDLSTLLCHSSNSLGSATQRFYVFSLEPQTPAECHECSGRVMLPFFIVTVGALTAALICALLFAIRARRTGCHNPTQSLCTGDTSTAVMSQGQTSEQTRAVSITSEEDIYVNTNMVRKSDKPNTHLGHQEVAGKSSEKKNEEASDVIYSSVNWKNKSKKKGKHSGNRNPSGTGSFYLEEEGCMEAGICTNVVSNALEMGDLYGNVVTRKDAKKAEHSEYAKIKFRDKNIMHK